MRSFPNNGTRHRPCIDFRRSPCAISTHGPG